MPRWWPLLLLRAVGAVVGCTSPEATRFRGEEGADAGNHAHDPIRLHAGAPTYDRARTPGGGIDY